MVRLIIVRHAKTEWNLTRKIQGRSDIPLSPEGIKAATEAAALLAGRHIDRVICSPLIRARRTAELMLGGMPHSTDDRIIERDFGAYDGRNYLEMTEEERDSLFYGLVDVDGAESSEEVFTRTRSFVEWLKRECGGETVAVFSHGVCISYLLHAVTHDKWDADEYEMQYIKNCNLTEVTLT